ncbi:MAG: SDR family oxidoreductase [Paludibacteraceae bacterium]|nr:SDR family oxidoreductase [Paludibacteraceae bacterium]
MSVIVLTGGSAGIGKATAELLMKRGHTVYSLSRRGGDNMSDFASGGEILNIKADVTKPETMDAAVAEITTQSGRIDALVCNAGNGIAGAVEDTSLDEVRYQFETNFFGMVNTVKACLPFMRRQKGGRIVALSSVAAIVPIPFQAFYSASKSAVLMYIQALGMELAPWGIECGCVLPGDTKTDFTSSRKYTVASQSPDSPYAEQMRTSVGKMEKDEQNGMSPDVIAKAIASQIESRHVSPILVPGFQYKFICFLMKVVPARLRLYIVRKIYS